MGQLAVALFAALMLALVASASPEGDVESHNRSEAIQADTATHEPTSNQPESSKIRQQNKPYPKPVEVAPVSVTKDVADKILIGCTIAFSALLVLVGALQVKLLGKTRDETQRAAGAAVNYTGAAWEMLELAKSNAGQMERQLATASKSAEAARTSAETSVAALQISQRPWLIPTDDISVAIEEANGTTRPMDNVRFCVSIVNAGRMPALEVRIYLKYSTSKWEHPAPDASTTFGRADRRDLNVTMIGPGLLRKQFISTNALAENTEGERERVRIRTAEIRRALIGGPNELRLWIYGMIEYRDGFKKPEPYQTTFSFYWQPELRMFVMSGEYNHST